MRLVMFSAFAAACAAAVRDVDAYRVPDGVSKLQTFAALYNNAECIDRSCLDPNKEFGNRAVIKTEEKAEELLARCYSGVCDYINGRPMKISFSGFPYLNTDEYNQLNAGWTKSAEDAIESSTQLERKSSPRLTSL